MLNETTIEKLSERLVGRINNLNSYTLRLIGEQINRIGNVTPTNAYRLLNVIKYGGDFEKILQKISEVTDLNVQDIYEIFVEMAKTNYDFAKQFYEYRSKTYIPYESNFSLQQQVKQLADNAVSNYLNISRTLAFSKKDDSGNVIHSTLSETYQNSIDEAILSISQGKDSYQSAMKKTINDLGSSGIKTVDYASGYSRRLDSAVKMNIMDGMRDLHNSMQKIIGEEIGSDGIEISVHENPADDHEHIQGLQYSNESFELLNNELERPISTMNCYHYIFSIVLGVSEPRYSKEELQNIRERNKNGFEFNGKKYTLYKGKQLQRKIEAEVRKQKDIQTIAKASGNTELVEESQNAIRDLTTRYKDLSSVSGLPAKMDRLKVEGYKKTKVDLSEYYNNKVSGIVVGNTKITKVSDHFIKDSRINRKLKIEMIESALKKPLNIGNIKIDDKGRPSFLVIGEKSTLAINPETGVIGTGWVTGKRIVKKYKGDNNE